MGKIFNKLTASKFTTYYSEDGLMRKIGRFAKKAGVNTVYAALLLYYALTDKNVALKDKVIVIGALGYFICPIDAIPDLLGPMGYTDDIGALIYAVKTIWQSISDETREKARARLSQWFDDVETDRLKLF